MDPSVLIALASIVGAGLFTGAGYLIGDRRTRSWVPQATMDDEDPAPDASVRDETQAALVSPPTPAAMERRTNLSSSASYRTSEIEPLVYGSMQELLLDLAEQTISFRVALYDRSGLLVESVGGVPEPAIGALVGVFADCLHRLEETAVVREAPILEVHDTDHGTVRLRPLQWQGRTFVLTTIGPHRHRGSPTEDAVGDAIPTLLAS